MFLRIVYTVWLREMRRFWRDKARIIGNLGMPFIFLAFLGVGFSASFEIPGIELDYLNYLAPGIIGMSILFTAIFTGVSVIWDKQFGFMREMLVAPASRWSIVVGKVLGSSTVTLISALLVLLVTIIFGAIPLAALTFTTILTILVIMILAALVFVSLGLIIASRMNSMEGFQLIMSFLVMPLFLLSGAFFPIKNAPTWMQVLAGIDPMKYAVDGLRGTILNVAELPLSVNMLVLLIIALVMIFIASLLFRRMES